MNTLILRLVVTALLLCVFSAQPASARIWHILPDGTGDAPTIQAGIDSAITNDIVELACGTYYEHGINMKSHITLRSETNSPECVQLDGQGNNAIRCSSIGLATIKGLSIINCADAGIRLVNASLSIENCYFANNTFTDGGAIHMIGSEPTILDCTFVDNNASHAGGAIAMGGCATTIISCYFANNQSNFGGAVDVESYSALTMESCTLINNSATYEGGAIYVWSNNGPSSAMISWSTIMNNQAPQGSDAWVAGDCTAILSHCEMEPDYLDTFEGPGTIIFNDVVSLEQSTWSSVKALYR